MAALAATDMFVVGVTMPEVTASFTFSARLRRHPVRRVLGAGLGAMIGVIGVIVPAMFVWIVLQFVVGSAIQDLVDDSRGTERDGVIAHCRRRRPG